MTSRASTWSSAPWPPGLGFLWEKRVLAAAFPWIHWAITAAPSSAEGSNRLAACADEELMQRYARGELSAFEALFRRHAASLFTTFLRHGVGEADAKDLVQQAFFRAHQARRDYRVGAPVKPWLWTIALNAMRDLQRSQGRQRKFSGVLGDLQKVVATQRPSERESSRAVQAALQRLAPAQREVLVLHFYEQFTFSEISEVLGVGEGAVRVRAHRAYKKLRQLLGSGGREA